jgi:hypothetical protein
VREIAVPFVFTSSVAHGHSSDRPLSGGWATPPFVKVEVVMCEKNRKMARGGRILSAATIVLLLGSGSFAWAQNPRDLWHRTVPASACAPLDSVQAAKVRLQNGAWRFDGNNTGTVSFYCPVPINAWPADNDEPDHTEMEFYRVWYRDPDGMATDARVTTTLRYRDLAGAWQTVAGTLNSNVFANTGFTTKVIDSEHTFEMDALYSFYVTMSRTAATQTVEFHGIDFRNGLQPEG